MSSGRDPRDPGAAGDTLERRWPARRTGDGSLTFAHPEHGELCHSDAGAWQQARERYAAGCRLAERARTGALLRLLDVGTGLGWNLAAALWAVEEQGGALEAWSLEHDPGVLRATLAAARGGGLADAAEPRRWHGAVCDALGRSLEQEGACAVALGGRSRLWLVLGDARERLPRLPPALRFDAVFLDPFSPRVDAALWGEPFLRVLARRMAPGSWLATYSASFPVRVALARAGLRVGRGPRVGRKREGTLASPDQDPPALEPRTARRLTRRLEAPAPGGGP